MQTTASRSVAAPAARKSGGATNGGGPKSGKKKKTFEKVKETGGKELPAAAGPRPVTPAPVSGPWGNPKPVTNSAPPGFNSGATSSSPTRGFSDAHQRLLRHRALFAFRFLVGKAVELQLASSGARYAGVLDCVDPDDFSVVLKSAKQLSAGTEAEPFESGSTVIFQRSQIAHLVADGSVNYTDGVVGAGGASVAGGFRTDTEISGRQGDHLYGRELQTATSWLDPALDSGELEDTSSNGRRHSKNQGKAGWNQFEANEKLFGVVSTFDENIYTTKLDKSKISTEQSRAAERLAQEIERQASAGNFHLQEERGQTARGGKHVNNDLDEEARYSSVDRKATVNSGSNAYVPPALRNAQRQSSGGKAQVKATKTPPASAPVVTAVAVMPGSAAEAAPTSPAAPAAPKPLSFSDAVTGRSATTATAKTPASTPKLEPDTKKGAAGSPQKAAETAPVKSKDAKPAASAVTASSKAKAVEFPEKKTSSGKDRKTESVADSKSTSSSTTTTASTTTTTPASTTTTAAPSKAKPAAAPKKGLNPNAKEFKLSASAVEFTPRFATPPPAVKEVVTSPYRGGSPGSMPYQGGGYPPEEWMYDVGMGGGEEGTKMGMVPYIQGGYAMPMAPNGVPMMPQQMYPPMMPQQNMRMMGGHRSQGNYGGYQQQPYNPRGYYPGSGGYPGGGMPYPVGAGGVPGGVGPQPPLPREPTPSDLAPTDSSPVPPTPEAAAEVGSAPPSSSKQAASASKKK